MQRLVKSFLFNIPFLVISSIPSIAVKVNHPLTTQSRLAAQYAKTTFIINVVSSDINNFSKHIQYVTPLKKYGRVQINVGTLADKGFYEIPKSGNPWAEYASNNANLPKFFPDRKIEPFLPADFVKKNRELLLAKVRLLKENDMEATIFANEPGYLPGAFFQAYPQLRGPRVDHPRRSTIASFSPCLSHWEMQEIYTNMMAEMLKAAPEIKSYLFKTNDAGSGNCWTDWLYSGPNGPDHCKDELVGQRMANFFNALQKGAAKAGTSLDVYLSPTSSNFTDDEKVNIAKYLPANCYFYNQGGFEANYTGSDISFMYPILGVADIISFLNKINSIDIEKPQTLFINFTSFYNRGNEDLELEKLLLQLLADRFAKKYSGTPLEQLQQYCLTWVGNTSAQNLVKSFIDLNEAFSYRSKNLRNLFLVNWSVAARMINRPLIVAPHRLNAEEEKYFLPYIFNKSAEEARMDYTDIQGATWHTEPDSIKVLIGKLNRIGSAFNEMPAAAPQYKLFSKMAVSLKVYACLLRSIGNFTSAQKIRDDNAAKLKGPSQLPAKTATWSGEADLLKFNAVMRDELDNTVELVNLLEHGGLQSIVLAKDSQHEDCFLLGPGILNQLKEKQKIMLTHWTDIEDYMTSPFK